MTTETEITIAAVRMLATYKSDDGRRFHPDDTLAMIVNLIDNRHPDLDQELASRAKPCGYCGDKGYYFNDKNWQQRWAGDVPDWDNGGFNLCTCPRSDDVDMTETPTKS